MVKERSESLMIDAFRATFVRTKRCNSAEGPARITRMMTASDSGTLAA
jgi:hypothetical protein